MRTFCGLMLMVLAIPLLANDDIVTAYDQIVALDSTERKAAVARNDVSTQAALWNVHLDRFVAAHPELSDEQRSIVFEARGLLGSNLLQSLKSESADESARARQALRYFEARAKAAFGRDLYAQAFIRFGPPNRDGVKNWRVTSFRPECFCNPAYDECFGGECFTGSCWVMPDGCGPFGWDICTGMC